MAVFILLALSLLIGKSICANNTTLPAELTESESTERPFAPRIIIPAALSSTSFMGIWQAIPEHDLAGGVVRVSGDGPKLDVSADPEKDVGWDPPLTEEIIVTHPNYKWLPPLSECGFPAILDEYDKDEDLLSEETGIDTGSRNKRIVGGKVVPLQRHPWMVQLYLLNVSSGVHVFHCAGTLITNSTILTAAHCMTRLSPGLTFDSAVFENVDRRKIIFCTTSNPEESCSRQWIRKIHDHEVHDEYNEGNLNHDIALIFLKKPIKFNANVRPICLPYTNQLLKYWNDLKLVGLGWGATNKYASPTSSLSDVLKQVQFDLQPRSLCNKFHSRIYGRLKADRICTGGNTGRASCNGDSGGAIVKALAVPDTTEGNVERVFQFGIVSAGGHPVDTCGFQGRPTIDTNVLYFMDWILNHITPGALSYQYVRNRENSSYSWIINDPAESDGSSVSETNREAAERTSQGHRDEYINEFSTGQNVDVSQHPNVGLLPSLEQCGNLPGAAKKISSQVPFAAILKEEPDPLEYSTDDLTIQRKRRIVGGNPVNIENFYPWMAQIYVRNAETNQLDFRCSGTIISKRHILTAAHCVAELMAPFVFDSIVVGQYNRNATRECVDDYCFYPKHVKFEDVVVHADYEKYTHKNNIALIRLKEDLSFTRMVQPICLPRREALLNGIKLNKYFSVGWGRILRENIGLSKRMSEILLQLHVGMLPRRECDFVYSRAIDVLDRSRLCGGGKPNQGECLGDGGSPLMKQLVVDPSNSSNYKVFQLGVVSTFDCGMQGMPTVYINVIYFMDWILNNLVIQDDSK